MAVQIRKNSMSAAHQIYLEENGNNPRTASRMHTQKHDQCSACCGFYGPNFEQPLCTTCHAFLYPQDVSDPEGRVVYQEKSDSEDSGNEEPSDFYETLEQKPERPPTIIHPNSKADKLSECITALISPNKKDVFEEGLMENLPSEVLTVIFSYLDDFSLWNCTQVCKRWGNVVEAVHTDDDWQEFMWKRWRLFQPTFIVPSWKALYCKLARSSPCMLCLHQMTNLVEPTSVYSKWRTIRLRNELKFMHTDPPEGINAVPLDDLCFHWQASIEGPVDSPYEGGIFFLYLQIPPSYPMKPPIVRFITKIFHPNISRHGDIGIDSIRDNWSLVLTISKILISIQSLLTDPYCHVCMEPEIGTLFQDSRATFDTVARLWTMKFAMFHRRIPMIERTSFISGENSLNL